MELFADQGSRINSYKFRVDHAIQNTLTETPAWRPEVLNASHGAQRPAVQETLPVLLSCNHTIFVTPRQLRSGMFDIDCPTCAEKIAKKKAEEMSAMKSAEYFNYGPNCKFWQLVSVIGGEHLDSRIYPDAGSRGTHSIMGIHNSMVEIRFDIRV